MNLLGQVLRSYKHFFILAGGLGYDRRDYVCLTWSAVILVPFHTVPVPGVPFALSAVLTVPYTASAVSLSALF